MNHLSASAFLAVFALACAMPGPVAAQSAGKPLAAAPELVQSCEVCHGKNGDSQRTDVPRLNGQKSDYLLTRQKEFLDLTRGTPHAIEMMWQNATRISDDEAATLARYFGGQAPTPANGSGPLAQAGANIYLHGAKTDIPACASCHGAKGEGLGAAPRIAGQHKAYLVSQLTAFMLTARVGSPMNHHTWSMTPDQMDAVSAYLSNN